MQIVTPPPYPVLAGSVVTIGSFDGLHVGHARLIDRTVRRARQEGLPAVLLTFWPHPQEVLRGEPVPLLLSRPDRETRLAEMGLDLLVYWPFSAELAARSPEEFVSRVLLPHFRPRVVFVGFNFTFGLHAQGNAHLLERLGKEYGFEVGVEPPATVDGVVVSSSTIRATLSQGDIVQTRKLLGYWPYLRGTVVPGEARGRKLGFPTANLLPPEEVLWPKEGVYAAYAYLPPHRWPAVLNIGHRPTFGKGLPRTLEVHLLGYGGEPLYGQQLKVEFRGRLRAEQRFDRPEELVAQINKDVERAMQLLRQQEGI
ncbi:MAG: bifunctional riboflavin kinase/FAD synthetase [Moorellales bacterium]